jgi:hypothetical protein
LGIGKEASQGEVKKAYLTLAKKVCNCDLKTIWGIEYMAQLESNLAQKMHLFFACRSIRTRAEIPRNSRKSQKHMRLCQTRKSEQLMIDLEKTPKEVVVVHRALKTCFPCFLVVAAAAVLLKVCVMVTAVRMCHVCAVAIDIVAGPRKTDDTVVKLRVTLEDCYLGKTVKHVVPRNIYEKDPDGPIADRAGNRYNKKTERQVLEVLIERGMKEGQHVTFRGKGDQLPGQTPGDVVIVIEQLPHDFFQRRGSDLIIKREITLLESLTGARFMIPHLDGRKLLVSTVVGEVVAPDSVKEVADEGMPVYGHPHVFGVLFVQFEVKFPEKIELTEAMKKVLSGILPGPTEVPKLEAGMLERSITEV